MANRKEGKTFVVVTLGEVISKVSRGGISAKSRLMDASDSSVRNV